VNLFDYGARLYDPAIGRWFVVDMLANHELQIDKSPYAYGWNNPIKYVDPNGLCPNGCSESEQSGEPYRDGAVVQNKYGASQWSNGEWKKISSSPMTGNSSNGIRINGFFGGGSNGFGNQANGGGFGSGFVDGFGAGVGSTVDFFKSLGTAEGWQALGQGLVDSANLGCTTCPQGIIMRAQMADATANYVQNIPNMSSYQIGYDLGFGTEKLAEAVLISKGAGFGLNAARVGFGQAAFESSLIGGRSALFGRARLGSFGGNANGLLNRGYARIGWSYSKGTHYFQPRFGPKFGAKHYTPWFKYKP
jgi:RHS repeat-associated core domain